jgi:drug/metabolite transporter (DMT)-like permease
VPRNYLAAVAWMMGALVSFTLVAIGAREASKDLSVVEIMLWRNLGALCILVVAVPITTGGFAPFRTRQIGLHITRNVVHFGAQYAWLMGLTLIPLAQLFALEFTAPLWVALLAPLILGERLTGVRMFAAVLGFAGALIVVKPFSEPLSEGAIYALASALGFALSLIMVKRLVQRDSATTILFFMVFLQTVPSLALAWPNLHVPPPHIAAWAGLLAVMSLTAHFSLARAFAHADAIVVAPLDFLRLPLIAVVAALAYAEALDPLVLAGGAVIVVANLVNMRGERRRSVAAAPAGRGAGGPQAPT